MHYKNKHEFEPSVQLRKNILFHQMSLNSGFVHLIDESLRIYGPARELSPADWAAPHCWIPPAVLANVVPCSALEDAFSSKR